MAGFDDQTIVVTGAASGIGKAIATGFLRDEATVVGVDLNHAGLEDLADLGALIVQADVTSEHDVETAINQTVAETGRIDVLFNNAGVAPTGKIEASASGAWEASCAVHLHGALYGMRAAIPHMRAQGYGRIVNTISRVAELAQAGTSAYAAGKAGVWALSRAVAHEVEDVDILVNMLIPGPTNTPIWGRDMPRMQAPEAVYPTARMLASLPADGPSGVVFWDEREYPMFRTLFDETFEH